MKMTTKMDISGFKELKKQLERTKVDVGYVNTPNHWLSAKMGHDFSVAALASHLHDNSPWADQFMLSESRSSEVNNTVQQVLSVSFGKMPNHLTANLIGMQLAEDIKDNINNVSSPPNSTEWADIKGFNDPLVFGSDSRIGETPNLISEITHKVRG